MVRHSITLTTHGPTSGPFSYSRKYFVTAFFLCCYIVYTPHLTPLDQKMPSSKMTRKSSKSTAKSRQKSGRMTAQMKARSTKPKVPAATKAYVDRKVDAVIPDERYVLSVPQQVINPCFKGTTKDDMKASEQPHWFLHNSHSDVEGGAPNRPGMELPKSLFMRKTADILNEPSKDFHGQVGDVCSRSLRVKNLYVRGHFTVDAALMIKHNISKIHCRLLCMEEKNTEYKTSFLNKDVPLYDKEGLREDAAVMSRWLYDPSGEVRNRQATASTDGVVIEPLNYFDPDQPRFCKFYPDPKAMKFPVNKSAVKVLASTEKTLTVPHASAFFVPEQARSTGGSTQGPPYNYTITGATRAGAYSGGKQNVYFSMKIPCPKYLRWSRMAQKTPLDPTVWSPDLTQGPDNFTPFLVPHFWCDSPSYYAATNDQFSPAALDYGSMVGVQYDIYCTVEPNMTRKAT